jgi:thiol-disulfide isomerase/thioredoxin
MRQLVLLAVLIAACSTGQTMGDATTTTSPGSPTTSSTTPGSTVTSSSLPQQASPDHDREAAPDFTLALDGGDVFTLSETDRPVYLIFWAEWCPVCRRELPVVDRVSADYAGQVDFIAPVWKSVPDAAERAAETLFQSGVVRWGLDNDEVVFALYGVPYQPVTVLIAADGTVYESWAGVRSEDGIRASIEALLSVDGA